MANVTHHRAYKPPRRMVYARRFVRQLVATMSLVAIMVGTTGCTMMRNRKPTPAYLTQAKQFWYKGVSALEMGKVDEAENLLRKAAEATPDDADTQSHLAEALWQRGSHAEALTCAEAACRFEPANARAAIRAGEMRLAEGDAETATQWAHTAIGLAGRSPEAWALRGRSQLRLGNTDQALADMQQSLRYAPNDTELLIDVAMLYRAREDHQRCLTTLHHLLDCHPPGEAPVEALALAGETYLAINRPQAAAENLRLAANRGNGGADFYYRLAEAEAACGHHDKARMGAERALAADANHLPAQQLMTRLAASDISNLR